MATTVKNNNMIITDIESIDQETSSVVAEDAHQQDPPPSPINNNNSNNTMHEDDQKCSTNKRYMPLLVINYLILFIGSISSSLLSKYYFIHKGSSRWVSTWVQSAGFPLLLFPILIPYHLNLTKRKPFTDFNKKMLTLSISIGIMLGFNNLLFSWGNSFLPVSTSALLLSSQLAFNLVLSVLIVKQKITYSNLNCVILLTLSSILLALDSSHEKATSNNVINKEKYFIGFVCTIGAGLLFALYLPVMEKVYKRVYCYEMVMEMQLIMEIAATILATIGMTWDGGLSEMKAESESVFDKGSGVYWATVMGNVVTWQLCFAGTAGMVFLTCSVTGGICMTALLSMNVVGGVVVFRDSFDGVKAVSTALCMWGFCSYVYGLYAKMVQQKHPWMMTNKNVQSSSQTEMIHIMNHLAVTD